MFKPQGIITPVLTALTADEKFDAAAYTEFINHLIDAGVSGIFPLGTNGEFYAFSNEEKIEAMKDLLSSKMAKERGESEEPWRG